MVEVFSNQREERGEKNSGIKECSALLFNSLLYFIGVIFKNSLLNRVEISLLKVCKMTDLKHVSADRIPQILDFSVTLLLCYVSRVILNFSWNKLSTSGLIADPDFCVILLFAFQSFPLGSILLYEWHLQVLNFIIYFLKETSLPFT